MRMWHRVGQGCKNNAEMFLALWTTIFHNVVWMDLYWITLKGSNTCANYSDMSGAKWCLCVRPEPALPFLRGGARPWCSLSQSPALGRVSITLHCRNHLTPNVREIIIYLRNQSGHRRLFWFQDFVDWLMNFGLSWTFLRKYLFLTRCSFVSYLFRERRSGCISFPCPPDFSPPALFR